MIAKYPAKCRYCLKPITVGKDTYDMDSKTSYHEQCREDAENGHPGPEAYALADALYFIDVKDIHNIEIPKEWKTAPQRIKTLFD